MNKTFIILTLLLSGILILFLSHHIGWRIKERKVLNVYILDKTVSRLDRPEHKSLVWIINHNRFVLPNKKTYSNTKDYFGFFPVDIQNEAFDFKSIRINEVDTYAAVYDIAYYADCYGVHSFEWYKGKTKPVPSQKVYGGLNQNDYLFLKKMLDNGKMIIGEYNMFSTPTNALVRNKTEELMGISWSGWSGKYFSTLDVNSSAGPPPWMKHLFESQHMGVWSNDKAGIVLINNDGLIEVLVEGKHLNSAIPVINSTEDALNRFGIEQGVKFKQWFEFIKPGNNIVHSTFKIDTTPEGAEILSKLGFSNTLTAIIEGENTGKYFYFCGDFAENPAQMWTAKLYGGHWFNKVLYSFRAADREHFFRKFYSPLINNIFLEYYESN
jgi:hypothetical protein